MVVTKDRRVKTRLYEQLSLSVLLLVSFVILLSSQLVYGAIQVESYGKWSIYTENSYDTYPVYNMFLFSTTTYTVKGKVSDQQIVGLVIGIDQYHNKMYFAFQFSEPIGLSVVDPNVELIEVFGEQTYAVRLTSVRFYDTLQNNNTSGKTSSTNKSKNKTTSNVKIYTDIYAGFNPELDNTAYVIMDERFMSELFKHKYCEITITVGKNFIIFVVDTNGLKSGVKRLIELYYQDTGKRL
jgi:hypothetical protein